MSLNRLKQKCLWRSGTFDNIQNDFPFSLKLHSFRIILHEKSLDCIKLINIIIIILSILLYLIMS